MIRLLIVLIIVALSLTMLSRMQGLEDEDKPRDPEETIVGSQLAPYNKAQQFSEDYGEELDKQREKLDEQIDGG